MHMADALVAPAVAGTMYVAAGAAAAYSIKKVREEERQIMQGKENKEGPNFYIRCWHLAKWGEGSGTVV